VRVLIAGGGTGGLATAIALRQVGIEPLVLEQAPEFATVGAGLGLQANAMKAITHIGADRIWRECSARIDDEEQRSLESGATIAAWEIASRAQKYGEHYLCGHRADLLASLLEPLPPECVRVASRVVALEQTPEDVGVELESGEEIRGDLLVGADGLRSTTRRLLFGEQEARFTGVVVWRGLMRSDEVPEELRWRMLLWLGPRRHVLVYPLRHAGHPDSVHSLSAFVPADEVQRESWSVSGDLDDLRTSLSGACDDLLALLDCMQAALITGIYFRDPVEVWGSDRVVLLGDAAHPAPPNAGQGAGMALEDAVMLAACLRRHGPREPASALREYESRRKARTVRMLESSRVNLLYSQVSEPAQVRARDGYYRGLRSLSDIGSPMREWLLAHDAVAEAADDFEAPASRRLRRPQARRAFDAWQGALTPEQRANGWLGERAGYVEFMARECSPREALPSEAIDCDGVPAVRVLGSAGEDPRGLVVLHLHGGGYTMGSAASSVGLAARLGGALGGWALIPDYRLAPEHPFPAALEDAVAAYLWLGREHPDARIVVTGECAGGGLAVSLALDLRERGEAQPSAIHVVSPFCDLGVSALGFDFDAATDPWLDRVFAIQLAAAYVQDADVAQPLLSPLQADLSGLPPLLIHAAREEALCTGAALLAEHARDAHVDVQFSAVEDSVHSFVLFDYLPEAAQALEELARFVRLRALAR
jgi:salicylate hydroxylase